MKKYFPLSLYTFLAIGLFVLTAHGVLAIDFDPGGVLSDPQNGSGLSTRSANDTIFTVVRAFLQTVGVIALILIIYGGFTWMTGGGNSDKIERGREILFWAVIGVIVILSSLGIVEFLDSFL